MSKSSKTALQRLGKWYRSQCNGEWEQKHGLAIESCDNPGWWVKIDLAGTALENKTFKSVVSRNVSVEQMNRIAAGIEPGFCNQSDWLVCEVKGTVFHGAGDTEKLERILEEFLNWAEEAIR